jgi:hypothetical protein
MAKSVRAFAIFTVPLFLLTLACSALGGPEVSAETIVPAIESSLQTEVPTAVDSSVLFSDDFSDSDSGWDRVQAEEGITDYENGAYRIFVDQALHDYWANPGRSFGDVRVEVDATKIGGPDNNDFGVICRYQDNNNFYAFLISSDGYYAIMKYTGGSSETLGTDGMLSTDAVNLGASTNTVRADCVGDTLSLYANGTLLHSVSDAAFASGDVGLIAGTFDEPGADIAFDSFLVLRP